jgi:hypothetical protein
MTRASKIAGSFFSIQLNYYPAYIWLLRPDPIQTGAERKRTVGILPVSSLCPVPIFPMPESIIVTCNDMGYTWF